MSSVITILRGIKFHYSCFRTSNCPNITGNIPLLAITIFLTACTGNDSFRKDCTKAVTLKAVTTNNVVKLKECATEGIDFTFRDEKDRNLVAVARDKGHTEVIEWLTQYQYGQWKKKVGGLSVDDFLLALEFDNHLIVRDFVENGIEVNEAIYQGMVPAAYAIFHDSHSVLKFLLRAGADVHAVFDFRPLITMAAMFEQDSILLTLISYGADVNDHDGSYVTPLMFAARDGNVTITQILLENGADTSLKDRNGDTALDWAIKNNHEHLRELLTRP